MKEKRKANRSDVIDELRFISNPPNNYSVTKRDWATKLRLALEDFEFEPEVEILNVIDILNGHAIVIPRYVKKLKQKAEVKS